MTEITPVSVERTYAELWFSRAEYALTVFVDLLSWQKVRQFFRNRYDRIAGSASAMGDGPGLVKVVVYGIHSQGCEVNDSRDCVHIGSVHVDQTAGIMNRLGNLMKTVFKIMK